MKNKREHSRSGIWMGSILLALLTAVGIYFVMLQIEKNLLSEYEKVGVYMAVKEIPRGIMIEDENVEEYLEWVEIDKGIVPATALTDKGTVTGLVAKTDIEEGVLLTTGMFQPLDDILRNLYQPVIAGFKAEDLFQVVGGVLRCGDRINIYTIGEDGRADKAWENVYVQQVFDNSGKAIPESDRNLAAQRINIYLSEEEVEPFYTQLSRGTLRAVKLCEGGK